MISNGNMKLGKIPNYSQTPGMTCPGRTGLCSRLCYAGKANRAYPSCNRAWSANASRSATETELELVGFLTKHTPGLFRIHVAGDFQSVEYVHAWTRVAEAFPGTKFLAFTRSWRVPELADALAELAKLANVVIYASLDDEAHDYSGPWPTAYMGEPSDGRTYTECRNASKGLTCDKCKLCWRGEANVHFPLH